MVGGGDFQVVIVVLIGGGNFQVVMVVVVMGCGWWWMFITCLIECLKGRGRQCN